MWGRHILIACVCIITTFMQQRSHLSSASVISECPGLEVDDIRRETEFHELSLLFYHVSWSNSSRSALAVFNEVASFYDQSVNFAVIDCWHLACNCSRTHPGGSGTPNRWPTLMSHCGRNTQLQYFGDWTKQALTRFIDNLFRPLERVHDRRELKTIAMRSDAVVLGLFPHPNTVPYRSFVGAAIRWLETDPEKSFRFAVSFGSVAAEISQQQLPIILLLNPRGVEVFKPRDEWNTTQILLWAHLEMKRAFNYLSSYSSPMTAVMHMHNGPSLTIFANDLDAEYNFNTVMSKELDPRVMTTKSTACYAHGNCKSHLSRHQLEHIGKKLQYARKCPNIAHLSLLNLQNFYLINDYLNELICGVMPACIRQRTQADYAHKLLEKYEHSSCLQQPQLDAPEVRIAITRFLKLSVERLWNESLSPQNRTLTVTVLDQSKYKDFLQAQAIDKFTFSAATTFIVDPKRESIYVMHEKFSYASLMQFVKNYYTRNLLTTNQPTSQFRTPTVSWNNAVYLHDFNRQAFLNVLSQQNITTVALLYTPICAFSAIMSQTLIQIAAMVDNSLVNIVRINTQTNMLPWEFVMPETPTIIVFPRGRAIESRVFPAHFKADVRNVFAFILAQMEPIDQLKTVLSSCRRNLRPEYLKKCLLYAKNLATQHIGHHLKLWQIFETERDFILARLKQFKDITLDIKRSFMF